jgi:hypothetical protein
MLRRTPQVTKFVSKPGGSKLGGLLANALR